MKHPISILRRLWLIIIVSILLLIGVVYVMGGYLVYDTLTRVKPQCGADFLVDKLDNTPAQFDAQLESLDYEIDESPYFMPDYETVTFGAREDDVRISAWFVSADIESEKAVIIVHGIHGCRREPTVLLAAGMLTNGGFNVLLIDMRNHGDSEITDGRTAAGNREYRDVLGGFDWLVEQGYSPDDIGIMGISLGGSASLIAFGQEPEIAAVWVDSTFADINDLIRDELARSRLPGILVFAADIIAQISGVNLREYNPMQGIAAHNGRSVFITHSNADHRLNVDYAYDLHAAAGENATLWIVNGYRHIEAIYNIPETYAIRLTEFFSAALGEPQ